MALLQVPGTPPIFHRLDQATVSQATKAQRRSRGSLGLAVPTGRPSHRGKETAAHLMVGRLVTAARDEPAQQVVARLQSGQHDFVDSVFVVEEDGRLCGAVRLPRLLAAGASPVGELIDARGPAVRVDADQETVASQAIAHGLSAVPVVDADDRLLGVVPPEALIEVLRHEHVEDLHRLAGIRRETVRARHAIEAPPLRRARDRLPWLVVGLVGSMLATLVMAGFERTLGEKITVAFFIPGIVYLADAIGTQTEAIAVRGLSLSHARIETLVGRELRTGALLGAILGLIAFPLVLLGFGDASLAAAVAIALIAAGATATTVGLVLPWLLHRLGLDPAFGSGPIATIFQDVLSLLIYFACVLLLVRP